MKAPYTLVKQEKKWKTKNIENPLKNRMIEN